MPSAHGRYQQLKHGALHSADARLAAETLRSTPEASPGISRGETVVRRFCAGSVQSGGLCMLRAKKLQSHVKYGSNEPALWLLHLPTFCIHGAFCMRDRPDQDLCVGRETRGPQPKWRVALRCWQSGACRSGAMMIWLLYGPVFCHSIHYAFETR